MGFRLDCWENLGQNLQGRVSQHVPVLLVGEGFEGPAQAVQVDGHEQLEGRLEHQHDDHLVPGVQVAGGGLGREHGAIAGVEGPVLPLARVELDDGLDDSLVDELAVDTVEDQNTASKYQP